MKYKAVRILLLFASLLIVLFIGILIGHNLHKSKDEAPHKNLKPRVEAAGDDKKWYCEPGEEGDLIYENYWAYVASSYIIVGDIPNCALYKIIPGAPRNDYVKANFYTDEDGFCYYHDASGERTSTLAVDLSVYQDELDYQALAAAGVTVCMLRVGFRGYGSGAIVEDEMFETHYKGAIKAGMKVGVYFFSQAVDADEGREEAEFVLDMIKGHKIKAPVVIDTEFIADEEARTFDLDNETRTAGVVGFCERVKEAGYTPMVYANRNWFVESLDMSQLLSYKLWLANYAERPDFPYVYTGWQYTDSGSVPGIPAELDLNVWME